MIQLPKPVKIILNTIKQAGHQGYIVGGCVRDALMGRFPKDWDIATSATPDQVKKIFLKTYDTGIKHGTVTVRMNNESYEVTTYRVEGEYKDHRRPSVVNFVGQIELDLARRDFTINAIAYHPDQGLVDPYGGMKDIKKSILKAVGNPEERFTEDALRILRGIRFSAQLGFTIEEKTLRDMIKCSSLLEYISKERIRDEMMKILLSDCPDKFRKMYKWGLLQYVLPELIPSFTTPQHHPHHVYDVGIHTIKAVEQVPQEAILRLAMLLHDIGKPATHTRDKEGIDHFFGHVPIGVKMTKKILRRLRFDNATIMKVTALVEYHDFHIQEKVTRTSIKDVLSKIGEELFEKLLIIQRADALAQNPNKLPPKLKKLEETRVIFEDIIRQKECYRIKDLAINGKDLVLLGIKEGKMIGDLLQEALEYVIKHPARNNKEHLLNRIAK